MEIRHDISQGAKPNFSIITSMAARDRPTTVTLHPTNDKHLTTMPCLTCLPHVTHIEFDSSCACIVNIDYKKNTNEVGFLSSSDALQHVDMSACSNLVGLGPYFLYECNKLECVIFPPSCPALQSIGPNFMKRCRAVKAVDLTGFINLKIIGNEFLRECYALKSCLLPKDGSFTVGDFFMAYSAVESVDLGFMSRNGQTEVSNGFLMYSTSLAVLDLNPLRHVEKVGNNFLSHCEALISVDFSTITKLSTVGSEFLSYCEKLETAILPPSTSTGSPLSIGHNFLCSCRRLRSVNIDCLAGIDTLGAGFLLACEALEEIDLTPLANVERYSGSFLAWLQESHSPRPSIHQVDRKWSQFPCWMCVTPLDRNRSGAPRGQNINQQWMFFEQLSARV